MVLYVPNDYAHHSTAKPVSRNCTHQRKNSHIFRNGTAWKDGAMVIFGSSQLLALFSMVAVTGFSLGFLENFCYINLRQIYTKHGQMELVGRDISLCRVFTSLGGVLCWFYSGALQSRFGPDSVMFASVSCLPLCFFLYAGIEDRLGPVTKAGFLLSEAIRSGIFAALWSTATIRLNELSPPDMKAVAVSPNHQIFKIMELHRHDLTCFLSYHSKQLWSQYIEGLVTPQEAISEEFYAMSVAMLQLRSF